MLLVYLVLAGQYGSWVTPAAVILGVPLALLGTAGALLAMGIANNIYTQIGLVLLIALSAKNAILIVEVARSCARQGHSITDAAVEAARKRFRPILMTSFAFILGVLPLVLAKGAGRRRTRLHRHRRLQRHAGLDLSCGAVRALVLRDPAALAGASSKAYGCRSPRGRPLSPAPVRQRRSVPAQPHPSVPLVRCRSACRRHSSASARMRRWRVDRRATRLHAFGQLRSRGFTTRFRAQDRRALIDAAATNSTPTVAAGAPAAMVVPLALGRH